MDYGLKGRTAVVTGADSGMGLAVARMLLDEGVRVVISDKAADSIAEAAQGIAARGKVHAFAAGLMQHRSVEQLRNAALERMGQVDILVNAAGITGPTGPFHEIDDEAWLGALQIDLMGAVRVVRAFVPHMMERGGGRIVLFGSEDAEQSFPDELPYCAAQAAILNLSKGLSKAYAEHGILVNAVSPGFIATPMTDAMTKKRAKQKGSSFDDAVASFLEEERPTLKLQRRGEADEAAAAVLFLCSRQASFITGANLRIDGGSAGAV